MYNSYNKLVNSTEVTALKEMIFQRANERANTIAKDIDSAYIDAAQNDVMNMARDSFVTSTKNPFSQIIENEYQKAQIKESEKTQEIGFPQRKLAEKESQAVYREKVDAENVIQVHTAMMNSAALEFGSTNKGFMGALNFLNSQASVSLLKNKSKNFDITA